MTREVLEKKLKIAGIPDYIYNLTGQGKKDECLCLTLKMMRVNFCMTN